MELRTIEARVGAGAQLLDRRIPGWADHIDLSRLDLSDCHRCVLGQLLGDFFTGRAELLWFRRRLRSKRYGFDAFAEFDDGDDWEFAQLTTAWTNEIIARRRCVTPEIAAAVDRIVARVD